MEKLFIEFLEINKMISLPVTSVQYRVMKRTFYAAFIKGFRQGQIVTTTKTEFEASQIREALMSEFIQGTDNIGGIVFDARQN